MNSRNVLGHIIVAVFSLLAAFFSVFQVLFTDANGVNERAGAVLLVLVVYTVISILAHRVWPTRGWVWVRWLVIPGLLVGGFYVFQEFSSLSWYGVSVLAVVIGGSALGREVISKKRGRAQPNIPTA